MASIDGLSHRHQPASSGCSVGKFLRMKRRDRITLAKYLATRSWRSYGNIDVAQLARNHPPFLKRMDFMKKLDVHDGCVNTICWNKTGEYILSGSDDCNLILTRPTNMFDTSKDYTVLHKIPTKHQGNIFSADFIVNSGDQQLVSCSSEGPVIVHDINATNPSDGLLTFSCHTGTIYEVTTVPDDDKIFLTCGEDKTVRLFDMRIHNSCRRTDTCPHPALIKNSHAMTTLHLHPLNSNLVLVGRADGIGLVYDRRKLPDITKYTRERAHADRLAGMPSRTGEYCFRHPLDGVVTQFTVPGMEEKCRFTSLCYNKNGTEVLASFSGDYIYLFDHDQSSNMELIQTLQKTASPKKDSRSSDNLNNNQGGQDSRNDDVNARHDGGTARRARQISRIRVRGDWSDTGAASVPLSRRHNAQAPTETQRQSPGRAREELVVPANERPPNNDLSLAFSIGVRWLDDPLRLTERSGPNLEIFDRSADYDQSSGRTQHNPASSANQAEATRNESRQPERTIEEEDGSDEEDRASSSDSEDDDSNEELDIDDYTDMETGGDSDEFDGDTTGGVNLDEQNALMGLARHTVRTVMSEAHAEYRRRQERSRLRTAAHYSDYSDDSNSISSSTSNNTGEMRARQENKSKMLAQSARAKFKRTLDELKLKYDHIPTRAPRVKFQGHRNSRTSIQQAIFWGDDCIMSGSDCGRIMVWEKDTAKLVMGFQADERVVNCLAPNPRNYVLASSGIDYDIKLWSTQSVREGPLQVSDEQIKRMVENNELMLEESKQTISVPPHLFFRVLASLMRSSR